MEDLALFSLRYAEKLGASYAESRLESVKANNIVMKNGVIQATAFEESSGLGMRFIINNKLGFISSNKTNRSELKKAIKQAITTTKATKDLGEDTFLAKDRPNKKKYSVKQKVKLSDISMKERIIELQEAEKAIICNNVNTPNRFVSYSDTETTEHIVNSLGTNITSLIPKVSMYYFLTVVENNKAAQRFWSWGAAGGFEQVKNWNLRQIFHDEITSMHKMLTKGKKSPKGKLPIVCGPQVTGIMVHESAGHPYEADRILGREAAQAGESFITEDLLKTKIGSKHVTVIDDPTIKNSYGFYLYDNEGVKAKKKYLVKNGKINEFLHNRETAYAMKTKSNGSSRVSDYDKENIVRMSNTYLKPGKYKEEELFEGIKKGVYIKNFMEWNIDDRRKNAKYTGAECYLIENGKITKPLLNPVLEVTTKSLWSAVDAVANNLELHAGSCGKGEPMQAIPVTLGGPSIRLRGLRIK